MEEGNWLIGEVKSYNSERGFGFLTELKTKKDYFFHISQIRNKPVDVNSKVVFQVRFSEKKQGTLEACYIIKLSQFQIGGDNNLIYSFFNGSNYNIERSILEDLPSNLHNVIAQQLIDKFFAINDDSIFLEFQETADLIKKLFSGLIQKEIIDQLISEEAEKASVGLYKIKFWIQELIKTEPNIQDLFEFFLQQDPEYKIKIYNKLNLESRKNIFSKFISQNNFFISIKNLLYFLNIEKDTEIQQDFISILSNVNYLTKKLTHKEEKELNDFIFQLLPKLNLNLKNILISFYYEVCTDYNKMILWLNDFIDRDNYNVYFTNFIFLESKSKVRFIKKCFYLLNHNVPGISLSKILKLKNLTLNYKESRIFHTDFSTNVLLSTIEKLQEGLFLNEESIFEILTQQVNYDPKALLSLTGYFEECHGRYIPDQIDEDDGDNRSIISLKKISSPQNIDFCEGVKFGGDGKDKTYKHDCWWCRGSSCYFPNQSLKIPDKYLDYTLSTFLNILAIKFDAKSYFNFLGLLNKINVFLKHLNCRDCGHVLNPVKEGHYSFYRVSNFKCSNANCENNINVYLNHCLGSKKTAIKSKCDNLIDSRDTNRCNYFKHSPQSEDEKYGPYICNICGSCCSQKSLKKKLEELKTRKWNILPGLKWKVENNVGHLERDEVFCFKCGSEMVNNEREYLEFVKSLEMPDKSFKVLKKGTNTKGFWYLIKAEIQFYEKASRIGLRVSDSNGNDQFVKFISEGNINYLTCTNCSLSFNKKKAEFVLTNN